MSTLEYKEMNLHQHVLARPDTYVGGIREQKSQEFVAIEDEKGDIHIEQKFIYYTPALLRIFIEALSNAIDNKWRSDEHGIPLKTIKVTIDQETGETSVWNDGLSIPIRQNDKGVWIPQMIFGQLLTSSNYNDDEDRYVSGRNGLGVKLCSLFSSTFKIKLSDPSTQQTYTQKWSNNMTTIGAPRISKTSSKGFTEVRWIPDFSYFGLDGYSKEMVSLFTRYIYDASMLTGVSVYLNGKKLQVKTLKDYAKLYMSPDFNSKEILCLSSKECQVVLTPSHEFQQVSFTNGVYTSDGGIHVDVWQEAIFKLLTQKVNSKSKNIKMSVKDIKQYFRLFVICSVANPEFTSQSKTCMSAPKVSAEITTSNINTLLKWDFMTQIQEMIQTKEMLSLKKSERKTRGNKHIEGYDPANKAGSKESSKCTLILCEGLSAKTYAVTGIQQGLDFGQGLFKGRNYNGIMALRGKLLNTRNASISSIADNKEISNIIQVLGLQHGVDYTIDKHFSSLRYGRILILCDADCDGFHIEGLILNTFDHLFPTLFTRKNFIMCMQTPVMKIQYNNQYKRFYDLNQAHRYLIDHPSNHVKYYKGLGTSSDQDIRDTFGKRLVVYHLDEYGVRNIKKAFDKKLAISRKQWLEEYEKHDPKYEPLLNDHIYKMDISDFIDSKLIQFSIDDCKRSLPHLIDGFKESQRKVIYACFLKNLNEKTLKVAQLAGFVAEKTNYHHGEQCLYDTIVKMAQDFVGSNNLPLLLKDGQFGTRLESGGRDAANARYIYTKLRKITRMIFRKEDDAILTYRQDDGEIIEPEFYLPILPMILVNGGEGIGTGWSCSVPCYNPLQLIEWIECWLNNDIQKPTLQPWYNGFKGNIDCISQHKFTTTGILEKEGAQKYTIKEIPVGSWINPYKEFLEDLVDKKKLKKIKNQSTPDMVHFEITECPDKMKCTIQNLKLINTLSTTNLVLFTEEGQLKKFNTIEDILDRFCKVRLHYYNIRKEHTLKALDEEYKIVKSKYIFLKKVMNQELVIFQREEKDIEKDLDDLKIHRVKDDYDYLLSLPMKSFTKKRLSQLKDTITKLKTEIEMYEQTSTKELWKRELDELRKNI